MKRNPFNLEIVTAEMVLAAFRKDFAHVGPVSVISYDLGDGVTETYAQVHVTPQLTAVLHDDIDQIVLKANGAELFTVAWNAETEDLLHKFSAIPPHQAFAELAAHGIEQ